MHNLGVLGMSSVGILVVFGMIICSNPPVFGVPMVQVSPTCGPADPGFNIVINANGFAPNSNVSLETRKFQRPESSTYAYFQTNATGGLTK